ncbi:hypothetical protein HERIO_161 [Hepatospora eriocheir]|uniref:Uncharacterized protein n=1 Tax=Hepatospora eriocheir TaxID=1081669 RepID=A0A1X0QDV4_9MICR|nr:hypothetical protein HERIO_161 [Hepatospora eriocheir]
MLMRLMILFFKITYNRDYDNVIYNRDYDNVNRGLFNINFLSFRRFILNEIKATSDKATMTERQTKSEFNNKNKLSDHIVLMIFIF